jgi:hypothetical protein
MEKKIHCHKMNRSNKDDLLRWKLQLFASPPCQDSLNWHSHQWDKAMVGGKMVATWAPQYLGAAKKVNLVMMFGYASGGYLMAKMTPSSDVDDDDDSAMP